MITGHTFLRQQDMSKVMYISKMTFVSTLLKQDRKVKNEKKTKKTQALATLSVLDANPIKQVLFFKENMLN